MEDEMPQLSPDDPELVACGCSRHRGTAGPFFDAEIALEAGKES